MKELMKQFIREEKGVTTVEYAIMLALVALAVALATPGIRDAVVNIFVSTADNLNILSDEADAFGGG
jgi:pilus assembly protein Flp/PilA